MLSLKSLAAGMAVAAFCVACGLRTEDPMVVRGTSMLPALRDGQRLNVKRFTQDDRVEVARGDVVAFWFPNDPSKTYFARLVGMPGETVEIREEGAVFIDGRKLDEPYVDAKLNRSSAAESPVYVKPHYYYVLGDNRDNSSDSRQWGLVPEKYIHAKIILP